MNRHAVLFLAVLLCGGCTTESPPLPAPPTSMVPSAEVPRSAGVAITEKQLADADPCGLLNQQALSRFGTVSVNIGREFSECEAEISLFAGDYVTAHVSFDFAPHEGTSVTPVDRGGVTVYGAEDSSTECWRYIVVSEHATIRVGALWNEDRGVTCPVVDAAVEGMQPQLRQGVLLPAGLPGNSLGRADACGLLDHADIQRIAGIEPRQFRPGYGGHFCEWNTGKEPDPGVLVTLTRSSRPEVDEGTDEKGTVAGYPGIVDTWVGGAIKLPSCGIDLVYRPLDHPSGTLEVEVLHVSVSADKPEKESCRPATDLAAVAVGRLPRG